MRPLKEGPLWCFPAYFLLLQQERRYGETRMLKISGNEVHLWAIPKPELISEDLVTRYRREILSDEERQREKNFHAVDARRQYVTTRALVRTTLSKYTAYQPENLVFDIQESGKPTLSPHQNFPEPINFNVSHTRGRLCLRSLKAGRLAWILRDWKSGASSPVC